MDQDSAHLVLVVDDDPDFGELICAELERAGYSTLFAKDGKAALRCLSGDSRPSVILLDLTMPVMGGKAFRDEIEKHPGLSTIPMVVITAGPVPKGLAAGVQVLQKPLPAGLVVSVVAAHCRRQRDPRP